MLGVLARGINFHAGVVISLAGVIIKHTDESWFGGGAESTERPVGPRLNRSATPAAT